MKIRIDAEIDVVDVLMQASSALTNQILEARATGDDATADRKTRLFEALRRCAAQVKALDE